MGLYEDLRALSEQVKRRQAHVKGEEATKQALILPFLQVLGFDVYDPTEVQPEYTADFARRRSNGAMEKVDYALRVDGQPALFVECKALDAAPEDHDGQLARYFNATPTVKVGIVTNGLRYRFFTDLHAPNVMDPAPLLARGFEVEAAPEGWGKSRVYVSGPKDAEKLRALLLVAFEEQVKRGATGDGGDAASN